MKFIAGLIILYTGLTSICLADNIALNKPAYQIGYYGKATPDKAIDGKYDKDTGDDYLKVCAYPDTSWQGHIAAKWWLDLDDVYTISTVTVYNTFNMEVYKFMDNFAVDIVTSDNKTNQSCGVYSESQPVSRGGNYTFHCNNIQGRYVYIRKLEGSQVQERMVICEVEIEGFVSSSTSITTTLTKTTISTTKTTVSLIRTSLGPLMNIPLFGKSTNQTGVFGDLTSDKAVDGIKYNPTDGQRYCAHPANSDQSQPAEWWIDLGEMYKIHSVTLYNTGNAAGYFRMEDFAIRVYSSGVASFLTCAEYPETVESAANVTLPCEDNVYGRYVQFIRLGKREINLVTICEVEITGQRYSGCPDGYYGNNCDQICGQCTKVSSNIYNRCDKLGHCINGCEMWWIGKDCKTKLDKPFYTNQAFMINDVSSNTIAIQIVQVDVPEGFSEYYGYRVKYNEKSLFVRHDEKKRTMTVTLNELSYNTNYTIKIQPYRVMKGEYDYGMMYPVKTVKTPCTVPGSPTILFANYSTSEKAGYKIVVKYQLAKDTGCDYFQSIQMFYQSEGKGKWSTMAVEQSENPVIINVTDPDTYVIKMRVLNNEGLKSESEDRYIHIGGEEVSCSSTLPWVLFGVACAICIICVIILVLSCCKRKKQSFHNATTQSHVMSTLESRDQHLSHISINDEARQSWNPNLGHQQPKSVEYEEVDVRNINLTSNEMDEGGLGKPYESLHGQVTGNVSQSTYETIH